MMFNKCIYCLRAALHNIRRNIILHLLSASTVAVTFIVFISFLLLLLNVSVLKKNWIERMQVIVYFKAAASAEAVQKNRVVIESMAEVESAQFVSREDALALLQTALQGQDGILEGLSGNPLPHSIEIKLKDQNLGTAELENFIHGLEGLTAVDDIEYGQKWLERFRLFVEVLSVTGVCLGVLLFLFTLFIISNTLRLMGFCFEGIIQGLCGATAALAFFVAAERLFLVRMTVFLQSYIGPQHVISIDGTIACYVLLLGGFLGLTGSLVSLGSLDELQR
jgi:cell division transport system permease protein